MENIIKFEPQNNVLSNQEIESLFKGLIKLVEKNTEQKLKNAGFILNQKQNTAKGAKIYNFSTAVKDISDTKFGGLSVVNDTTSHTNNTATVTQNTKPAETLTKGDVVDSTSQLNKQTSNNNLKVIAELQNIKAKAIKVVEENKLLKQKLQMLEDKLKDLRTEILNIDK